MSPSLPRGVYHYGGDKVVHGLYDVESLLQEKRRAIRVGEKPCHRFQLCVVGDVNQGKTSTVRSLTGQDFLCELPNTEGVDVRRLASILQADRAWTVMTGSRRSSSASASESGEVEQLICEHVGLECARRAREQPVGYLCGAYVTLVLVAIVADWLSLSATGHTSLATAVNVTVACAVLGVTCTSVRLGLSLTNLVLLPLMLAPLAGGSDGGLSDGDGVGPAAACTSLVAGAAVGFVLGFLTGCGFGPGMTTGLMLCRAPDTMLTEHGRLVALYFGSVGWTGRALAVLFTAAPACAGLVLFSFWKHLTSSAAAPTSRRSLRRLLLCFGSPLAAAAALYAGHCRRSHAQWLVASFVTTTLVLIGLKQGRRHSVPGAVIRPWTVVVSVYTFFLPGVLFVVLGLSLVGWKLDALSGCGSSGDCYSGTVEIAAKMCFGYTLSKVSAIYEYLKDVAPSRGVGGGGGDSSPATGAAVEAQSSAKRQSAAAAECDDEPPQPSFRMVIRDFAGHSTYRPMQQAFMPRSSFYLVTFSWRDADRDADECAARLAAWLALVQAHVGGMAAADGVVMLVGTHADDVDAGRRSHLERLLQDRVPPSLLRLLRCRSADSLAFAIENSRGPLDVGVAELRRVISDEVRRKASAFFPDKIPLRWWEWLGRSAAAPTRPFDTADRLYDEWRRVARDVHQVDVLRKDFDDMIGFFHDIGEVYVVSDPSPGAGSGGADAAPRYVFLDVQFIVDAAGAIAADPPLGSQPPGLREDWCRLSATGVCRPSFLLDLFEEHFKASGYKSSPPESFDVLMSVLQGLDLFQRVVPRALSASAEFIFVPEKLPPSCPDQLWAVASPREQQVDVYVYVDMFTAEQVFYRLLCHCASQFGSLPCCNLSLYRDAAEIKTPDGVFLLRLLPECRQTFIVLTIRAQTYESGRAIVQSVSDALKAIVDRDFPYLSWRLNLLCPLDGHRDSGQGRCDTGDLHLLHHKEIFDNPDVRLVDYCRGRALIIHQYKVRAQWLHHKPSLCAVVSEDVVEKLVTQQLNTDDFKRLAAALGLSYTEVSNVLATHSLSSRDGRLETMRLWKSRAGDQATYAALVAALEAKELREAASFVCLLLDEPVAVSAPSSSSSSPQLRRRETRAASSASWSAQDVSGSSIDDSMFSSDGLA